MLFWIILTIMVYSLCGLGTVAFFISREGYGTLEEMLAAGLVWPIMLVWYFLMDED